jgi:hypothetical protein
MSRDDRIDYEVMYPPSGRNRKSRAAHPRNESRPLPHEQKYAAKKRQLIAARNSGRIEARRSETAKQIGKRYDDGDYPRKNMARATKELLCDYPDITLDRLVQKLERMGYEAALTTIALIRRDFLDTIKVAREMGYIKILD